MRVVVTGATGNIGTSVVQRLAREPQVTTIVALARHQPDLASLPRAKFVCCDVAHGDLVEVFRGAQAVIHFVSSDRAKAELGWSPARSALGSLLEPFDDLDESSEHNRLPLAAPSTQQPKVH